MSSHCDIFIILTRKNFDDSKLVQNALCALNSFHFHELLMAWHPVGLSSTLSPVYSEAL